MKKQKLSTEDILNHEFKRKKFRGIHPEEVDEFLNVVLDDYEYFAKKIVDLDKANEELRNENFRIKMDVLKQATHTLDVEEIKDARIEMNELKASKTSEAMDKISKLEEEIKALKDSL